MTRAACAFCYMDFATRFDPKEAEDRIYRMWEAEGYFTANAESSREPFTIVIPPPNVTGSLHIGHALNNTIQDLLTRWKRMEGYEALYLPGTDHAGIATQTVVEKELKKEGKTREQLGREVFLQKVWEWKEKYGNTILYQLRRLGCACDWTRARFTMDEAYSRAIRHVFVFLFKKGLIYRGLYTVNWCPRCLTALSDLECPKKEEPGHLWHVAYPLKTGGSVTVATTRPETILGDMALAVNPKDERFAKLVGKTAVVPFINREIPIIADDFVDTAFGTGMVKITPAHDAADFECATRHGIKATVAMDEKGVMNENAGPFKGLDRFDARKRVVEELEKAKLLVKTEDYVSHAGRCYRCDTIIEPYLSEQWFVRMKALAEPAIEAVRSGDVKFHPERWSKLYLDWMENIRDWCISRQIWWGHRVPVWYCACGEAIAAIEEPSECPKCGLRTFEQDEDVLDTWFSSALWPFATLGWPEETEDLEKFYPTQALVTDRGIINLWVARMIMSGFEFRGEKPFSDVIIHATIMDDEGQRMSKSKGTGVDPLILLDQYGADALRFALAMLITGSQDFRFGKNLSKQRTEQARNFVTKLWNAARYVAQKAGPTPPAIPDKLETEDRWILSRLSTVADRVSEAFEAYEIGQAAQALYKFVWNDFCDWYIELSKRRVEEEGVKRTLACVLDNTLRLLHPIMPFVTEEIWQRFRDLGTEKSPSIMTAAWANPPSQWRDPQLEERMERVFEAVGAIREHRAANRVEPKEAVHAVLSTPDAHVTELLQQGGDIIRSQANVSELSIGVHLPKPKGMLTGAAEHFTLYLPVGAKFDKKAEIDRARREIEKTGQQIAQAEKLVANEAFRKNKPELAAEQEERLATMRAKVADLKKRAAELEELA